MPRTRPPYPQEFRREAIPLAQLGDKPQRKLARDSRISDVTLRSWLKEQKASRGERPGGLSGEEREELGRLRDENAKLRMEREILRKAAVFFERATGGTQVLLVHRAAPPRPRNRLILRLHSISADTGSTRRYSVLVEQVAGLAEAHGA